MNIGPQLTLMVQRRMYNCVSSITASVFCQEKMGDRLRVSASHVRICYVLVSYVMNPGERLVFRVKVSQKHKHVDDIC